MKYKIDRILKEIAYNNLIKTDQDRHHHDLMLIY
jgi:hypothetical protein